MSEWSNWNDSTPAAGSKVVIACSDGCSTAPALIVDADDGISALHGEDGYPLDGYFLDGSIWTRLPADYPLAFMEVDGWD